MEGLPVDVLRLIIGWLCNTRYICTSRLVCKAWKSAIDGGNDCVWNGVLRSTTNVPSEWTALDYCKWMHSSHVCWIAESSLEVLEKFLSRECQRMWAPQGVTIQSLKPVGGGARVALYAVSRTDRATPIWFRILVSDDKSVWEWTPDFANWMPLSTLTVQGGLWQGNKPVPTNCERIRRLHKFPRPVKLQNVREGMLMWGIPPHNEDAHFVASILFGDCFVLSGDSDRVFCRHDDVCCGHCGKASVPITCAGCLKRKYCSSKCQDSDWELGHGSVCRDDYANLKFILDPT